MFLTGGKYQKGGSIRKMGEFIRKAGRECIRMMGNVPETRKGAELIGKVEECIQKVAECIRKPAFVSKRLGMYQKCLALCD